MMWKRANFYKLEIKETEHSVIWREINQIPKYSKLAIIIASLYSLPNQNIAQNSFLVCNLLKQGSPQYQISNNTSRWCNEYINRTRSNWIINGKSISTLKINTLVITIIMAYITVIIIVKNLECTELAKTFLAILYLVSYTTSCDYTHVDDRYKFWRCSCN
jgi:hypothetical protein